MRHITSDRIDHADGDVMEHLEDCARCRSYVVVDVDLAGVRRRILDEVHTAPLAGGRSDLAGSRWRDRPWVVATVTAAVVVALFVPLAWLGLWSGGDIVDGGPSVTNVVPVVELPESPGEPSPEEVAPPAPSGADDIPSFEMEFVVGDAVAGRLIWHSPTFYEALRVNLTDEGAVFGSGMYRAGDNWGLENLDNSAVRDYETVPQTLELPPDREIPWSLLIERTSDEEMWKQVAGEGVEAIVVEPTHPDASRAWAAGGARLEVTIDGIPVIVERPGSERFEVVDLNRRAIRVGEIGNNTSLPFDYAVFLAATTTEEQRPVLVDGIVTFADYQTAAEAAAQCAGVEATFDDSTGMFMFSDSDAVAACVERYVDDIAAVWRVDSQWLDEDEWTTIWYTIEGQSDAVEMLQSESGPERALASGDGWAISISQRGSGYCTRTSTPGSFSEGCFLPSQMSIPHILRVGVALEFEDRQLSQEGQPATGDVIGLVTEQADRITIRFSNGAKRQIAPGSIVEFGFRGFGLIFDASILGTPTEVEVHNGDTTLGVHILDNRTGG